VSFDEVTTVFRDKLSITIADPDHSASEDRFVGSRKPATNCGTLDTTPVTPGSRRDPSCRGRFGQPAVRNLRASNLVITKPCRVPLAAAPGPDLKKGSKPEGVGLWSGSSCVQPYRGRTLQSPAPGSPRARQGFV